MSIAENYVPEDENTDQSQDDFLLSSSDDQDQEVDLDEFSSLLTDNDEISIQAESPSSKDVNDISALEELEAMCSGSDELTTDEAESLFDNIADDLSADMPDGVSVMQEIETMYGSSDESTSEETEVSSNIEQSVSENVSTGDAILQELEALLGGSVESVANSTEHEVETSSETSPESAGLSSNESETSGMSSLDELKAFLEGTSSHDVSEADDTYASNDEYLIESRRSVLDELQNLLQSCLDELKAAAEGNAGSSILSTAMEYPTHDELKNLLETKLRQLTMLSAGAETVDLSEGDSVLDELNALLYETANDAAADTDITNNDMSSAEADASLAAENFYAAENIDQYTSSTASTDESVFSDERTSVDSIVNEFEGLLSTTGETADSAQRQDVLITSGYDDTADTEIDVEVDVEIDNKSVLDELEAYLTDASELQNHVLQDIDTENIAEETTAVYESTSGDEVASVDSVVDEFESLLSATGETTDSVQAQDSLTMPANDDNADAKTDGESALDELESYLNDSSEFQSAELQHIDTENSVKETEVEAGSGSTSDVLEQLQAMLDEAVGSGNGENSKDVNLIEDDFAVQQESSEPFIEGEREEDEYISELKNRKQSVDAQTDSLISDSSVKEINYSPETENNKRLPWLGMSLFVATVVGVIVLWEGDLKGDRLQVKQRKFVEKPIVDKAETKSLTQIKAGPSVSVLPTGLDNVDKAIVSPASSGFESQSLYENEAGGLYGNEVYDSYESEQENLYENEQYETSAQPYDDKAISSGSVDPGVEMNASQMQQSEVSNKIADNRLIESLNQQIEQVQYRTENSIALLEESIAFLNERMVEAESTISALQFALGKHEQHEPVPAYPVASKVNDDYQIKQSQHKNEENIALLSNRLIEAELTITKLQFAIDKATQGKPVQSLLKEGDAYQIKQVQHKNKENISLLSERLIEAESSILKLQSAIEKAEQLESERSTLPAASKVNNEYKTDQVQHNNEDNIGSLNERVIKAESSISQLQLAVEEAEQLEPVQSVSSITSKMNAAHLSKVAEGNAKEQTYNIWSVHLLSYYGKPPPARELKFLDVATVPYEIEKVNVKGGVWHRVLVNNSSQYSTAKKYAEMLKKRLGIKKIWISKKQYRYE